MKKVIALVASLLSLPNQGLATENYTLPTYTPAYEPKTVDERGLWMDADQYEKALAASPLRIDDKDLTDYVRRVLCQTVGRDRCEGTRIYIVDVPAFNATMVANGAMSVWSGLLLRVRSEAELGAVLGHEFGHFELRHSLKGFQSARSTSDALAWTQILGAIARQDVSNTQVNLLGSYYHFSRAQETEADLIGLRYLGTSPYPSRAASEIWQHLMEEADATAAGRMMRKQQRYQAGFFDSHPTSLTRADYLLTEAIKIGDTGDAGAKSHYAAIAAQLPRFLASQIKLNDFAGTEYILSGIAATMGWTGELLQARADMFATRGNARDLITATTLYLNALDAGYRKPETLRGLGLSLIKSGQKADGARYLQEYLTMVPNAPDAKLITFYLPQPSGNAK